MSQVKRALIARPLNRGAMLLPLPRDSSRANPLSKEAEVRLDLDHGRLLPQERKYEGR
jgi:hypothetical protein